MEMGENSDSNAEMGLKSSSGKRLPLPLGRKNDRDKEQHCGEQHNGGTGGNIPVGRDKHSSH